MGIPGLSLIGKILKPALGLMDKVHTSDAERLEAKAVMMRIENELEVHYLELKKQVIQGQTSIIVAETQSQSILARNWRPALMVLFGVIIAHAHFTGVEPPEPIMLTINIGLGGYIGGRSLEGISGKVASALAPKNKDA